MSWMRSISRSRSAMSSSFARSFSASWAWASARARASSASARVFCASSSSRARSTLPRKSSRSRSTATWASLAAASALCTAICVSMEACCCWTLSWAFRLTSWPSRSAIWARRASSALVTASATSCSRLFSARDTRASTSRWNSWSRTWFKMAAYPLSSTVNASPQWGHLISLLMKRFLPVARGNHTPSPTRRLEAQLAGYSNSRDWMAEKGMRRRTIHRSRKVTSIWLTAPSASR